MPLQQGGLLWRNRRHRRQRPVGTPQPAYIAGLAGASSNGYFVDQYGNPRLVWGDAVWALCGNAGRWNGGNWRGDFDAFVIARASQGFTVLYGKPMGTTQSSNIDDNGGTFDGLFPFLGGAGANPSTGLTPAYWARIDYFLNSALAHGITFFFNAVGYSSDFEGGPGPLAGKSAAEFTSYGTQLGTRYKNQPNIAWVLADDYFGGDDALLTAFMTGARAAGDTHVATVENMPESDSRQTLDAVPSAATWGAGNAQFSFVYSYNEEYYGVERAYAEGSQIPVIKGDGYFYQGNPSYSGGTGSFAWDSAYRQSAWWALAAGARGVVNGSENIWTWQSTSLASAQQDWWWANNAKVIRTVVEGLPGWQNLFPDLNSQLVTGGRGTRASAFASGGGGGQYEVAFTSSYVAASITPDHSLALLYLPKPTTITVNTALLGPGFTATWVDPVNGATSSAGGGPAFNSTAKGSNSQADADWALVLQGPPVVTAGAQPPQPGGKLWRRRNRHKQLPTGTVAAGSPDTPVAAGLATATGMALAAAPAVAVTAGLATATGTALAATPADGATAGLATATAAAQAATPAVAVTAGLATATATSLAATAAVNVTATAGLATATAASLAATPADGVTAGLATATGTALAATPAVAVTAGLATATAASLNATVSTSGGTSATAGLATATAAAQAATAAVAVTAGLATATAASLAATPADGVTAGLATATGTALAATPADGATAGLATATAAAQAATPAVAVTAGLAAATGTALAATASPSGSASVTAGLATATAASLAATPADGVTAGLAAATGTALAATPAVAVTAGLAAATAASLAATVSSSSGTSVTAGLATATAAAQAATAAVAVTAGLATATGTALAATAAVNVTAAAGLASATGTALAATVTTSSSASATAGLATATAAAAGTAQAAAVTAGLATATATAQPGGITTGKFANAGLATATAAALGARADIGARAQLAAATGTALDAAAQGDAKVIKGYSTGAMVTAPMMSTGTGTTQPMMSTGTGTTQPMASSQGGVT